MKYYATSSLAVLSLLICIMTLLSLSAPSPARADLAEQSATPAETAETIVVTTNAVSNTTASSTYSGGTITGSGYDSYGICWSTSENPTISDSKSIYRDTAESFKSVAGPLESETTYYIRAYATQGEVPYYGEQVSVTTSALSDTHSILLHNPSDGNVIWWKINSGNKLISKEEGTGWGAVTDNTEFTDGWRIMGSVGFVYNNMIIWHDQDNGGLVRWWRLNNKTNRMTTTSDGQGVVSETMEMGPEWKLGGVCKIVDNALIWHNTSTGQVVWWKILYDGSLLSEKQGLGWNYVNEGQSVPSYWSLVGTMDRNDEHILFWQSQADGKVAWWKLSESGSIMDTTQDSGWGFVSENVTVPGAWKLIEVVENDELPVLIWHNQNNGKVVWWRLNNENRLMDESEDGGWGFVSKSVTVSSNWRLFKVLLQSSQNTLLWQNENNGKMVWWKTNSSWYLRSEDQESGWGFVSDYTTPSGYLAGEVFD